MALDLHPGGEFKFDGAVLERRLADIVPDVILQKGSRELLVEFFVTHECDGVKIAKIRALGISAVEIDLSKLPADASPEDIDDAILRSAPRRWLANPRIDAGQAELRRSSRPPRLAIG